MKNNYFLSCSLFVKNNIKFILAVSATYLFFLITNLPANVVISFLKLPGNIKVTGITGTAWSGAIRRFKIDGIDIGSVSWKLQPLYLMLGAVSADISIVKGQQHLNSWVKLSYSGKVELEETKFEIDLLTLQPLTYGMPFSYAGMASGYFPVTHFYKENYIGINGKLSFRNIEMTSPQQQTFGNLDIDFRAENDGATSGRLKDNSEQLNVSGHLTLNKSGILSLSAKLAAQEKGSSLESVVSFLGPKDASGRVQLNNRFKLWN